MKMDDVKLWEDLLTMNELLELLKFQYTKHTIYRWIQQEEMPHVKVHGRLWFPKLAVCKWLTRGMGR